MPAKYTRSVLFLAIAATTAVAEESPITAANSDPTATIEETLVVSKRTAYANNAVTESMLLQNSAMTSVNDLIDNLPGVSIQEGDAFGFDDWSTSVSVRGFQTNLGEQQVGSTIDGLPNGNSNYGGGAKANRYIDTANIETVEVSQGTADIASRSLEALGGTLNYVTSNPTDEERVRVQYVTGDYAAQRYYARYDSGLVGDSTRFWVSASHQEATDWIEGSAQNRRDHMAAKLVSGAEDLRFTAYASYDDAHEDNYQRVYSEADFKAYPRWDQLIGNWTDIPYVNQSYRRGWSTLRENVFTYGKLDWNVSDTLSLSAAAYYHHNQGRGDWVPPYLVDVVADNGGPETELGNTQTLGGPVLGQIFFVDGNGTALQADPNCVSSLTFPYGGGASVYDPACYAPGAIPMQSFRNTEYEKERIGFTLDGSWDISDANTLRAGIWYEDSTRKELRDWHKIVDARVGMDWQSPAYWVQYSREYPQDVAKWYLEDQLSIGDFTINLGVKQFMVEVSRDDVFGESPAATVNSDSDVLFSGGVVWSAPIDGLELFAGYAENFKSVSDDILERPSANLDSLNPETSKNTEAGLRWQMDDLYLTATYFDSTFDDRIIFLAPGSGAGNDYLIGTNGTYFNAGGIESSGFELSATYNVTDRLSLYGAYTALDATYKGTGDAAVDAEVGIKEGNDVTGIPDQMWVLTVDYAADKFTAGISTKSTGKRAVNTGNTWYADEYLLVDAYLSVEGRQISPSLEGLTVNMQVQNLTGEEYLGVINSNAAWLGAPRTAMIGLTFDF
mgnify:CR=1 FL=1